MYTITKTMEHDGTTLLLLDKHVPFQNWQHIVIDGKRYEVFPVQTDKSFKSIAIEAVGDFTGKSAEFR